MLRCRSARAEAGCGGSHGRTHLCTICAAWTAVLCLLVGAKAGDLTLITLDPGHFHAALFQRSALPGVAEDAFVFAPLGPDLTAHLGRVARFNQRPEHPTHWRLQVYAGSDFQERLLRQPPGQIVVLSGRNRGKVDRIAGCLRAGLHVLADKPWILEPEDLPKLAEALDIADAQHLIAYDAMTERFEVTATLQRALVNDPDLFGQPLPGTVEEPGVDFASLHYLYKEVAGAPNLRPPWFFDVAEQGEGLTDVGTHLTDMAMWVLFPDQAIRHEQDIQVLAARRWPTRLSLREFQRVTGESSFPTALQPAIRNGKLDYYCNTSVDYVLRGVHVRLVVTWDFAPPAGRKETATAVFRGSQARVEVRQGPEEGYRREVYVVPNRGEGREACRAALTKRIAACHDRWPGLGVEAQAGRFRIVIPDTLRASHEEHFELVARRFLDLVKHPTNLPAWEKPNLLAKYYVTTKGLQLARQSPPQP